MSAVSENDETQNVDGPAKDEFVEQRDAVALLLDDLLQVIAEGTRGGTRRTSVTSQPLPWSKRWEALEAEGSAAIRMLDQKNKRAAARAKQQKRRGLVQRT